MAHLEGRPGNRLLAALKPRDLTLLSPHLKVIDVSPGQHLFDPGDNVDVVHFPQTGTIGALILELRDGATSEAAMIGQEGAIGGIVSEGNKPAFAKGVIQIGGSSLRLKADDLDAAKSRSPTLRDHFARYSDCLLAQILQSTACNAVHDLDARLARWLLSMRDRTRSNELRITQDFIAQMLGVHRPYATRIVNKLEKQGLIEHRRGVVSIANLRKLEQQACECYAYIKRHFERLLPGVYPDWPSG